MKIKKLLREQRAEHKRQIVELLKSTNRKGIDRVLKCMEDNGFYTVQPHDHHKYAGGLAVHALSVCKKALEQRGTLPQASVILCAILHDFCDIEGFGHLQGHGRRSLAILNVLGLDLTDAEKCAIRNHMRYASQVGESWGSVMSVESNKQLHELIRYWDKNDAKHDNPLPKMVEVPGGTYTVKFDEAYRGLLSEKVCVKPFQITESLITWGLWRFVMGSDSKVEPVSDTYPEGGIDKRNRAVLVGGFIDGMEKEFLRRLRKMTGKKITFPTYAQRQSAMKMGLLKDANDKEELLCHRDYGIFAGKNEIGSAITQQCGICWDQVGYRLVTT